MPRRTDLFARLSLDYADHPKIAGLSDAAFRAHVEMILYSHRSKLSGRVDLTLWGIEAIRELQVDGLLSGDQLVNFDHYPRGGFDGRPRIPLAVRREVYERDNYQCLSCGSTENLSLDHITRYRDGGKDTVENLRVLCLPCNQRRG